MSKSETLPATSRRPRRPGPVRIRIKGVHANVVSFASPGPADHVWRRQLKATLGTVSDAFVDMALHHLERAARMPGDGPSDVSINGALAIIAGFAPKNEMEAAIALQAACTHMVAMVMMARSGGGSRGRPSPAWPSVRYFEIVASIFIAGRHPSTSPQRRGSEYPRGTRSHPRRRPSDRRHGQFPFFAGRLKISRTPATATQA